MPSLATWFSPSLQTISRSAGRSSVLAAAYRSCEKLTDERLGITRDFRPKGKHGLASNICIGIPNDDIGLLFNNAEKAESRVNSTVARELMVPLPSGWTDDERAQCARGLGEMLRARYGVAVLVSIHRPSKDNNNDHVHILFTTRTVDADGVFGEKTRILDDAKTGEVKKLREAVCELVNIQARAQGEDWYVYAGKFSDVITDHIPTTHISVAHGKKQKAYIDANREEVGQARVVLGAIQAREKAIAAQIASLTTEAATAESSQDAALALAMASERVTVAPTRKQVYERLRSYPELAELADEAEAGENEPLFEILLKFEADIKAFGAIQPEEEPGPTASADFAKSLAEAQEQEEKRLAHANAAIKHALADSTFVPPDETKKQQALRLHSVWATYEQHEQRMRDCSAAMTRERRKIQELQDDPPSFWRLEAKKEHKQKLYGAHANLLGLEVVYEKSKAYRANKQIRDMQAAFCSNMEYRQIVKDCAAQVPTFSPISAAVSDALKNNPELKKEACIKCEEVLHI